MIVERPMVEFLIKLLLVARSKLKSRARLEAENIVLRQQVIALSRKARSRVRLRNIDRLIFVWLCRMFPSILNAITVVKPETVIRWHRRGFRAYWRWKSSRVGGRPKIDREIRDLIQRMSKENPLWGAPRIHGELLMLGIEVAESTVARYMTKRRGPPSQGWKTFLRNQAAGIASLDLFVVRTISFKLLYGLVILQHARRRLVRISVTSNPTAEWIAGQVIDAFPWDEAPRHLIRDRDGAYGPAYTRRIRAMGIRDRGLHPNFPPVISRVRRLFRPSWWRGVCGLGFMFMLVSPVRLHSLRAVENCQVSDPRPARLAPRRPALSAGQAGARSPSSLDSLPRTPPAPGSRDSSAGASGCSRAATRSTIARASPRLQNTYLLRHSSRNLLLNDSMKAFCTGLPGSM